jgi:hypothetical protein
MDTAFVVTAQSAAPDPSVIVKHAREFGFELTHRPSDRPSDEDEALSFDIAGGGYVLVAWLQLNAHPDAHAFGPFSATADELKAARGTLVVTTPPIDAPLEQRDLRLAALASAVAGADGAIAVRSGHSLLLVKAALFTEMVRISLSAGALVPEIAVDITTKHEFGPRMRFLTNGMERFGREELYVTCSIDGKGALPFMLDMVRWLLTDRAKQLPTGHTVGRTPEEKIVVRRVSNPERKGREVIKLDFPG